ncbi:hypothetical protein AX14_006462 [Amanita brunnescens Koide BX004]|nr:hypothetical protein AX14_006462 [Amanita brunnescens Koide BX004]
MSVARRLRGRSTLATAASNRVSPDPFITAPPTTTVIPTQSSADEINAFADRMVRLSTLTGWIDDAPTDLRSAAAPSPSSNLPPGSTAVFSRPVVTGVTEDVPTAVPSCAPLRAASVTSVASAGDAGIAELLQPTWFPTPSEPPSLSDVIGHIHRCFPLVSLKVDDEDLWHFLAHDNTRSDEIANDVDHLLSSNTSWPSLFFFIRDTLKFESIKGPATDFQVLLNGLANIWSDAAEFDARELVNNMFNATRYFPKAEKEIDRLEEVSSRYRNERKAMRAQLKTTEAELSQLRQAVNDTLDSNACLLTKIDQLWATNAVAALQERDEARTALNDAVAYSKSAMAKQVSRYQHLSSIADKRDARIQELECEAAEKDGYILKTEREHAEIYREQEAAERQVSSLKQQLQDATSLFETTRKARHHDQEDFDERTTAFKKHIAELNARLNLLPAGEADLQSLVTDANERAGIAKEEYRKKSAELKSALKELAMLKAKQDKPSRPEATTTTKSSTMPPNKPSDKPETNVKAPKTKAVRWSFETNNGSSSQPFWDHSNEYSRYIASMVTATVTAIPNIPMQTAIATAINTVRAAGLAVLSQISKPDSSAGSKSTTSPKPTATSSKPGTQPKTTPITAPNVPAQLAF